jgi:D-alanyl-D-alanine carboxypeptidase (penicillin-binding protein 5/6)
MLTPRSILVALLLVVLTAPATTRAQATKTAPIPGAGQVLRPGDNGAAVEDLQRRLNARLDSTPALDVDGDYGEATRTAVARFQRSRGLEATGIADLRTRRELGDGALESKPVPSPEQINSEVRRKRSADSLDGPPFVTAKAWAIADGRSGEVLWGDHQSVPLPMASTTKVMTALIVVRLAEREPGVLDEVVAFSERADRTTGSTSGIRAGERLPVRELLYGLLLPSGNDAAVAFAEHFGGRLAPPSDSPDESDPLPRFVAEMNRVAVELGLQETRFANPHGLPASGHHSSARDLAVLARRALDRPLFASTVATARRGHALKDAKGNARNVVWTNTNRLLETEGYDGIKTGTTTAAGACLVASGRRGDDHLIVVVLGSTSADGRYTDARNLFRYGWLKRGQSRAPAVVEPKRAAP